MGRDSAISWTDHTFNPWWGCRKVSEACRNCYAETLDRRLYEGKNWGPGQRRFFGDRHWNEPLRWNRSAAARGVRERVFCASMADVFEDRPDLVEHRIRLWQLIAKTPALDWLLLTKRPENIGRMLPRPGEDEQGFPVPLFPNVWLGTTTEDQDCFDERVPHLLSNPATVHFVSAEPLLGPIRMTSHLGSGFNSIGVEWVIAGCESGPGSRATDVAHLRDLRDQCARAGVAFFLKQAEPEQYVEPVTLDVRTVVAAGAGSRIKGNVVELPYLDGVQHARIPSP